MKKYRFTDEEGKVVNVEEYEENEAIPAAKAPEKKDEEGAPAAPFTPEQMDAIRQIISEELAKSAGATKPAEAHDEEEVKKEKEEEMKLEDSKGKTKDSASPVSLENKSVKVDDSSLDLEEERNNAFMKRYGISR